mmetsp:Transcript_31/g.129  ORF Transcript_31/g.129 Transcript_31/m.129 type:complete len:202 (+) Transcript_31:548-1153(+)
MGIGNGVQRVLVPRRFGKIHGMQWLLRHGLVTRVRLSTHHIHRHCAHELGEHHIQLFERSRPRGRRSSGTVGIRAPICLLLGRRRVVSRRKRLLQHPASNNYATNLPRRAHVVVITANASNVIHKHLIPHRGVGILLSYFKSRNQAHETRFRVVGALRLRLNIRRRKHHGVLDNEITLHCFTNAPHDHTRDKRSGSYIHQL